MLEQEINAIRRKMKEHKITRKHVSEALGVHKVTVDRMLNLKAMQRGAMDVKQCLKNNFGVNI